MEDKMGKKAEQEIRANPKGTLKVTKKPYVSPQLIEYGNVEKLTRSGLGSGADGGTGSMAMKCL
jgi:hypothetical protein